jgi:hypothetical protein
LKVVLQYDGGIVAQVSEDGRDEPLTFKAVDREAVA